MMDVLRCELSASIERAFSEDGRRGSRPFDPLGEHLPQALRSTGWRKIRRMVVERDGHRCRACGKDLRGVPGWLTEVHHVLARIEGGDDHPSNLVTLCVMCHRRMTTEMALGQGAAPLRARELWLPRDCLEAFK